MTEDVTITMWTIYERPSDQPHPFVVREWKIVVGGPPIPLAEFIPAQTLEEARAAIPPGRFRMERDPSDDPVIVETWI